MKYTQLQLKGMARVVLRAKMSGDVRYGSLVVILSARTGLGLTQIENNITLMAA